MPNYVTYFSEVFYRQQKQINQNLSADRLKLSDDHDMAYINRALAALRNYLSNDVFFRTISGIMKKNFNSWLFLLSFRYTFLRIFLCYHRNSAAGWFSAYCISTSVGLHSVTAFTQSSVVFLFYVGNFAVKSENKHLKQNILHWKVTFKGLCKIICRFSQLSKCRVIFVSVCRCARTKGYKGVNGNPSKGHVETVIFKLHS